MAYLPENYGFDDLSGYEEARRNELTKNIQQQLAERRKKLAASLNTQGQQLFQTANPGILEDLNARGLFTSGSARDEAQARALKEIALSNDQELNSFDNSATAYGIQGEQDALDSALDLRRGSLEQRMADANANREEALARDLAKQQGRNQLYGSLIGAGSSLGGNYLLAKAMGGGNTPGGGGLGSLFGGGGGGVTAHALPGAGTPGSSLFPGGIGQVGTPTSFGAGGSILNTAGTSTMGAGNILPGIGGYYAGTRAFRPTQEGDQAAENVGGVIGGVGGSIFGPAGSAAGAFLGTAAGKGTNRLVKGIDHSLGNTAGSIARYSNVFTGLPAAYEKIKNPGKAIKSVGQSISKPVKSVAKSISSVFCFGINTPIEMEDGSERPIQSLYLGAKTKGGKVISIRISNAKEGDCYLYKGLIVTGYHAIKEDGRWLRVKDSTHAEPLPGSRMVWSIVTDKHRMFVNKIECADEVETDYNEQLTIEQSLEHLNYYYADRMVA